MHINRLYHLWIAVQDSKGDYKIIVIKGRIRSIRVQNLQHLYLEIKLLHNKVCVS